MHVILYCSFMLLIVVLNVICNETEYLDSTLTTAIVRENTSPKPTTVYRRINLEKDAGETKSSPVDIFQYIDARRKKGSKGSYIWKWDHWCQLQAKKGNCEKNLNRFFYNSQTDKCVPFIYSGCDGNRNNFETVLDCDQYCKGSNIMKLEDFNQPTFCYLQPDVGLCLGMITKYYYDINENSCKQFIYGGCGGNQNKFDTMFSCMRTCKS